MERLKKIISDKKRFSATLTEDEIINITREYLQILILKIMFQSKFGASLSFMGGTCLRICHDLKRFSEDLDFCRDGPIQDYDFVQMLAVIQRELQLRGFSVSHKVHDDKTVQKAFIKISDLETQLGLKGFRRGQKIHVKLEVDVKPTSLKKTERESFFVNRFQEIFPILKHSPPTLFAGKVLAILCRPYDRGRDYYDLIWYLSQKTPLNLDYLNRGMKKRRFKNMEQVWDAVENKVQGINPSAILQDIGRFLEDPGEEVWIKRYPEVLAQLIRAY